MSRRLTQLTIFVSGTSETEAEKSAFRLVVEELSKMLERTHGITLRVLSCPDDVRPGVNADPQAEINRQIDSSYDIYVGLFWSRFGTPTPRSGSGTEEEFERALATFQADSQAVRLLFYFKRAGQDPISIDPEQLRKVKHFRAALGSRGVLYSDFQDTKDFVQLLKDHVHSLIVKEWRDNSWAQIAIPGPYEDGDVGGKGVTPLTVPRTQDETRAAERTAPNAELSSSSPSAYDGVVDNNETELGYLDHREEFHRAAGSLRETYERLTAHVVNLLGRLYARSFALDLIKQADYRAQHVGGSRKGQQYVSKTKKVVDELAADLEEYVDEVTAEMGAYRLESRAMFGSCRLAFESQAEFQGEWGTSEEDRASLVRLIEAMEGLRQKDSELQTAIQRMPAVTGRIKRARKRTASFHGERIAGISFAIEDATAVLKQIEVAEMARNQGKDSPNSYKASDCQ